MPPNCGPVHLASCQVYQPGAVQDEVEEREEAGSRDEQRAAPLSLPPYGEVGGWWSVAVAVMCACGSMYVYVLLLCRCVAVIG